MYPLGEGGPPLQKIGGKIFSQPLRVRECGPKFFWQVPEKKYPKLVSKFWGLPEEICRGQN